MHRTKNALNFTKLLTSIISLFLSAACANRNIEGRWRTGSPDDQKELGILLDNVSYEQITELLYKKKIDARTLSKKSGSYEIYGISADEAHKLFPNSTISENQFIDFQPNLDYTAAAIEHSQDHLKIINAFEAWKETKGHGIRVAVIDTGLNYKHPEFANNILSKDAEPVNGQDDDQNGLTDDFMGWNFGDGNSDLTDTIHHGTAIAGIIASPSNGVAPMAKILPLKVINSAQKIDEGSVIAALQYLLDGNQVDIVNISFGKASINPLLRKTFRAFEERKILITAGIGNNGLQCELVKVFPASFRVKNILKVGATILNPLNMFQLASYSNFGTCVDILAPAGEQKDGIRSPYFHNGNADYTLFNGTSAATPIVTGVAALIKSVHPEFTSDELKAIILKSGLNDEKIKGLSKGGIINASLALKKAKDYHPTN
jgi:subtilisin family serine protease